MNQNFIKSLLPHLTAIAIFILISVIYFYPHLQGKVISQSDTNIWEAASHESMEYQKSTGKPALWNNMMFGGMPTYQIMSPARSNYLVYVQNALALFTSGPIYFFLLFSICAYIFYLALGMQSWLAILGSLSSAYVCSNFLLFEAGHNTKILVISFTGIILAGVIQAFKGNRMLGVLLFGFGLAFNLMNNHVQMSYYAFLLMAPLGIFILIEFIQKNKIVEFFKTSGMLIMAGVLALGASASMLWTTYEYSEDTMRGKPILTSESKEGPASSSEVEGLEWNYAMAWSNGLVDVMASFIPRMAGGGGGEKLDSGSALAKDLRKKGYQLPKDFRAPLYWGPLPFTGGPFYIGAIALFLFVFGFLLIQNYYRWWLLIATLLGFALSMGKNLEWLNRIFFDYFPLYNKFRAPSSMQSVVSFFFPILGIMGLQSLISNEWSKEELLKKLKIALGITGGFCLAMAFLAGSLFDFTGTGDANIVQQGFSQAALIDDRISVMRADSLRSLAFILIAGILIYAYIKDWLKPVVMVVAMCVLILFDLGGISSRYLSWDTFIKKNVAKSVFNPRPVDTKILEDKSNHRVLDLSVNTFNTSLTSYYHRSIGGNHAAKFQRYQDLIDRQLQGDIQKFSTLVNSIQGGASDSVMTLGFQSLNALNMLNTKYIIVGEQGKEVPIMNPAACGNAWTVKSIQTVANSNEEIDQIGKTDVRNTAIVHQEFASQLSKKEFDGQAQIQLNSMDANSCTYSFDSPTDQFVVFSEIWYGPNKGWYSSIDGKNAEHIRVDYALRGMNVPAGKHEIKFEFKPKAHFLGETISLICSLALVGLMLFLGVTETRKRLV
ncbi:MAG TPA: hypothetical protein PK006_10695 [Saprospiraceae bacterium]|nr:hypothetical protein [Saprospiraceae bacterium]